MTFLLAAFAAGAESEHLYEVRPEVVNVREGPGTEYGVVSQLRRGEQVHLFARERGWARVDVEGDGVLDGWIRGDLLAEPRADVDLMPFFMLFALVIAIWIYFLPAYVASKREHPNRVLIFVLDAIFGGTGIAWLMLLIWAYSTERQT
ncbi:MAG: superinfection immunity protein [Myxococcota bacterium]